MAVVFAILNAKLILRSASILKNVADKVVLHGQTAVAKFFVRTND